MERGQPDAYDNNLINKTTGLNQDLSGVLSYIYMYHTSTWLQVFFPGHPQGKKPGGCMIHVYIYIEERDMIHDYICMLDLCLYIVARDNHEN